MVDRRADPSGQPGQAPGTATGQAPAPVVAELELLLADSRVQQARIREALRRVLDLIERGAGR